MDNLPAYILLCASQSKKFIQDNRLLLDELLEIWSDEYQKVLHTCITHFDIHEEPINGHLFDYYEEKDKAYKIAQYAANQEAYQQVGESYVANKLRAYVEKTKFLAVLPSAVKKAHKGDIAGAWAALDGMRKSITTSSSNILDENADFFRLFLDVYSDQAQEHLRELSYGISTLDRIGFRPTRKTIGAWLAEPEIGKTAFACQFTNINARRGKKVLYVNLEGPGEVIAARIVLVATGLDYVKNSVTQQMRIESRGNGFLEKMEWISIPEGVHASDLAPIQIAKYKDDMYELGKNFRILTYTPSTLTAKTLRLEIEKLADSGWCPDIVILDHMLHMKMPEGHEAAKFAVDEYTKEFLSISMDYNLSFEVFHQPSVYGESLAQGKVLTFAEHSAVSKALKVPVSRAITMQSTPMEKQHGLARFFIEKNRSPLAEKKTGCMALVSSNFQRGLIGNYSCLWKSGKAVDKKDLPDIDDDSF